MLVIALVLLIVIAFIIQRLKYRKDEIPTDEMYYLDGDYQWKRVNHGAKRS